MSNTEHQDTDGAYFITPECRIAFPSLFKMRTSALDPNKKSFQAVLLFPPTTDLQPFLHAMKVAMQQEWGKVLPANQLSKFPIRAVDDEPNPPAGYEPGWNFIRCQSTRRPAVVDRHNQPVTDEELVYGGQWVRAYLNAWCWDKPAKGVSLGLNGIQLLRDDEPFVGGGARGAVKAFEALGPVGDDEPEVETAPAPAGRKPKFDFGI